MGSFRTGISFAQYEIKRSIRIPGAAQSRIRKASRPRVMQEIHCSSVPLSEPIHLHVIAGIAAANSNLITGAARTGIPFQLAANERIRIGAHIVLLKVNIPISMRQ
jgi:hypothetical protein